MESELTPKEKEVKLGKKKAKKEQRAKILDALKLAIQNKDKDNKPKYYYLRSSDSSKYPIVTICEIGYQGKKYRGIAICSANDAPKKSTGRSIALERALATAIIGQNIFPINRLEAIEGLQFVDVNCEWYFNNQDFYKGQIAPFADENGKDIISEAFSYLKTTDHQVGGVF